MKADPFAQKIGLATVVSENFLPGALVMIDSFLENNAWFDGDIIVIHEGLSDHAGEQLIGGFPNVSMHQVSPELSTRLDAVSSVVDWIEIRRLQFGSLEILSFDQYDRIIFCDSDLLFLDSIEELIALPDPLICCGDGATIRGNGRDAETFAEVSSPDAENTDLSQTFNSGFMIFNSELLSRETYDLALSMITADRWKSDPTGHTDQMLFNMLFTGQQRLVSTAYNYTMYHQESIQSYSDIVFSDAKVLHFNGPSKPWFPSEILKQTKLNAAVISAHQKWQAAFTVFLGRRMLHAMARK